MAEQKKFIVKNGLIASGLTYPTADGTSNQLLQTDASGNLVFATPSTDHLSEGTNKFYTSARFDTDFGTKTLDDITEGSTSVFYTTARFDSDLTASSTSDLSEGTNLYYTDARVSSYLSNNDFGTQTDIIAAITASAPATLDTLNELAAALGDDANFSTTITGLIADLPDSSQVSGIITADVDKAFIDALNVDADTLDGRDKSHYLDYNNFTNTPNVLDSSDVKTIFGASGDLSYNSSTGIFSIDVETQYTKANFDSDLGDANTDGLAEGSTNLYYTTARSNADFDTRLSTKTTTNIGEGTNLYYTDARVSSYLSSNDFGTQTDIIAAITASAPATLDTLNELAAALGDDANFSTTITGLIADLPDSSQVSGIITADVDKAFVDALNVDADTLDGQDGSYYLDYSNFTSTPNVLDSSDVKNIFSAGGDLAYNSSTGEFSFTATDTYSGFDSDLGTKTTSDLAEGTNLYYTDARADARIAAASTSDLTEGSNLYYTTARADSDFDTRLSTKTTTNIGEGTNLYYTDARADARIAAASTSNLTEGTNLYYTDARVATYLSSNDFGTQTDIIAAITDAAPATLDTLNELAAALGDDANFSATITAQIGALPDSAQVSAIITADVDKAFVDALNVDADTLDGQDGTFYLDYTNFTNTPNTLDSGDVKNIFSAAGDLSYNSSTGEFSFTAADTYSGFDSDFNAKSTDALSEGSTNLYFTDARADARIAAATTDNVTEGSTNLYYTDARANSAFDTRLATKNSGDLAEGSNLYYTTARANSDFDTRLSTKTTTNIGEGTNLYYTDARANAAIDARVNKAFVDALNVDADTLDGLNSTQFLRSDIDATHAANLTVDSDLTVLGSLKGPANFYIDPLPYDSDGGTVIIRGDLQVQGTTTTINSTEISIGDLNLALADNATNASEADGAGLTVGGDSYSGTKATLAFNGSTDEWEFNKTLNLTGSNSLELNGVDFKEIIEDHLANNTLQAGEGIDITYDDGANTITIAAELASTSNAGVAQFNANDFDVASGVVTIDTVDGGTY